MVHKPKHKVHSFRGTIASDDGTGSSQVRINLERQNTNLAYRIFKFQTIGVLPGAGSYETITQVWREKQTSVVIGVDFANPDVLGTAFYSGTSSIFAPGKVIIFDNIIFSRDIYVTSICGQGGEINYYIELEEVPVTAATLMQLKLGVARKLNLSESAPDA